MFRPTEQNSYCLETFEGPLDFLVHLIQRKEIDIHDVSIRRIIRQYLDRIEALNKETVDLGAEFIGTTASLLYLKSKMLLPTQEQSTDDEEDQELDPRFDVIHHLLDYCRFKEAAKTLTDREEQRTGVYHRGLESIPTPESTLGIEHLSFQELEILFEEVMDRAASRKGDINEEEWRVGDKIRWLRKTLKERSSIPFTEIFSTERSRGELIVNFLAVLEMMKEEALWVGRCNDSGEIKVFHSQQNMQPTTTNE